MSDNYPSTMRMAEALDIAQKHGNESRDAGSQFYAGLGYQALALATQDPLRAEHYIQSANFAYYSAVRLGKTMPGIHYEVIMAQYYRNLLPLVGVLAVHHYLPRIEDVKKFYHAFITDAGVQAQRVRRITVTNSNKLPTHVTEEQRGQLSGTMNELALQGLLLRYQILENDEYWCPLPSGLVVNPDESSKDVFLRPSWQFNVHVEYPSVQPYIAHRVYVRFGPESLHVPPEYEDEEKVDVVWFNPDVLLPEEGGPLEEEEEYKLKLDKKNLSKIANASVLPAEIVMELAGKKGSTGLRLADKRAVQLRGQMEDKTFADVRPYVQLVQDC